MDNDSIDYLKNLIQELENSSDTDDVKLLKMYRSMLKKLINSEKSNKENTEENVHSKNQLLNE